MILHTIEKVRPGQWFIWAGNPSLLDERAAIAGPFAKRYEALAWCALHVES